MAIPSIPRLAVLTLGLALAAAASAADEAQLIEAINAYRGQVQSCGGQASGELPPLAADPRLALPVNAAGDLQQAMAQAAYPMVNVQSVQPFRAARCRRGDEDAGGKLLSRGARPAVRRRRRQPPGPRLAHRPRPAIAARRHGRLAGGRAEAPGTDQCRPRASPPVRWQTLRSGPAAGLERHPWRRRRSAFAGDGQRQFLRPPRPRRPHPGDRAELAGYSGGLVGENIAAGQDGVDKVVDGWLASPGHCANLMNPGYRELGAAYATDPKSDAGIYWTAMFGSS